MNKQVISSLDEFDGLEIVTQLTTLFFKFLHTIVQGGNRLHGTSAPILVQRVSQASYFFLIWNNAWIKHSKFLQWNFRQWIMHNGISSKQICQILFIKVHDSAV